MEPNEVYTFHLLVSNMDTYVPNRSSCAAPTASYAASNPVVANETTEIPAPTPPEAVSQRETAIPSQETQSVPVVQPGWVFPPTLPSHNDVNRHQSQASGLPTDPDSIFSSIPSFQTQHMQHYMAQQETMLLMQIQFLRHIQQCQQIYGHRPPVPGAAFHATTFAFTMPVGAPERTPPGVAPAAENARADGKKHISITISHNDKPHVSHH